MGAVLGDVRHPLPDPAAHRLVGDIFFTHQHSPLFGVPQPGDHVGQLALPVAGHPGQRHNFTLAHGQVQPAQCGQTFVVFRPHIFDRKHHLPRVARLLVHVEDHFAAHH